MNTGGAEDEDEEEGEEGPAAPGAGSGHAPPGFGPGWVKLRGNQGWRDPQGYRWKLDRLHRDHWDVSDSRGNKVREVDFEGNQIWPDGPKIRSKKAP
jgi:hypothetical protein